MRSRFSAFAVGEVDYLLATWHRSTRPSSLELPPEIEWLRLEVREVVGGAADDDRGTVEFVAHFWHRDTHERGLQREVSEFVRENGEWFYVGGVVT